MTEEPGPAGQAGGPRFDAGDADAVAARKGTARREVAELRRLLALPEGRRFVWRVLERAGIYRQSFTGEPLGTAFNEGRRALGLEILAEIGAADPAAYLLLIKDNHG